MLGVPDQNDGDVADEDNPFKRRSFCRFPHETDQFRANLLGRLPLVAEDVCGKSVGFQCIAVGMDLRKGLVVGRAIDDDGKGGRMPLERFLDKRPGLRQPRNQKCETDVFE